VHADVVRLLALRSELGYTDRIDRALPDEPEAVSADDQRRLTRDARHVERALFVEARDSMRAALTLLSGASFKRIENDVRLISRTLDRMDRRV
jgi:hypothetical protein